MTTKFLRFATAASFALTALIALPSCDKDDDDDDNNTYTISGNASGSQVVPAAAGTGSGSITGTYNSNTRVLNYTSTWTGLSGAPTSAGIYSGAAGSSGTLVGSSWTLPAPVGTSGTYTGSMTLNTDQDSKMRAGTWYYTYGTAAYTGGEVRGQISVTQ